MQIRKRSPQDRLEATKPAAHTLAKALYGLREKNRTADSSKRSLPGVKELMFLGRLINSWKEIVGLPLAHKTCPVRLIKGRLYLEVADSQWMQTLVFYKPEILEKLRRLFGDLQIIDVVGRPGTISGAVEKMLNTQEWPDWEDEKELALPVEKPELLSQLDRCRRKLHARLRGLRQQGFELCQKCEATVTDASDGICAMCIFATREQNRAEVTALIRQMPWLTFAEVQAIDDHLTSLEFDALKLALLEDTLALIKELAVDLFVVDPDKQLKSLVYKEMVRAVMLYCGCLPDRVNLWKLPPEHILDPDWPRYLNPKTGEEQC